MINDFNNLSFKMALSNDDAEVLRNIRNNCSKFMTRYTKQISKEEQSNWWLSLDKAKFRCFIMSVNSEDVGYGVILEEENKSWLTGGVADSFRNMRLGKVLFAFLMTMCKSEVWLEVREDNHRARRLYNSLGLSEVNRDTEIITMCYIRG